MLSKVQSDGLLGIEGYMVGVEVDLSMGLPAFDIVGLPDAAVKESKERVKSAIKNCGFSVPVKRITINLAPADRKKEGSIYDLPITVALLLASEQIPKCDLENSLFIGELSLDGSLRKVNGILPMVMASRENGILNVYVPKDNANEAAMVSGVNVFGVENVYELSCHLKGETELMPTKVDITKVFEHNNEYNVDFSDVKGQENVKRAIEVAVAGGHNILMIGSPGSGKSMIAKRIPTILPDITFEEALETTKIHSVAGALNDDLSVITKRPFRSPHHSISHVGLVGGGAYPKPGEISLAHNGVLFLDELPEFSRQALEVMRQPLEDGKVTISRVNATYTYPSNVLFVASMNPCKCGYFGDPRHKCTCTPNSISKYVGKISGPLLDRIDIHIEVSSVEYDNLRSDKKTETSDEIKKRIDKARNIQIVRYKEYGIYSNSQITPRLINRFCKLDEEASDVLKQAFNSFGLSARAHDRILKVARTIADLDGSENIAVRHIAEAIQYRSLDRKFWLT